MRCQHTVISVQYSEIWPLCARSVYEVVRALEHSVFVYLGRGGLCIGQ